MSANLNGAMMSAEASAESPVQAFVAWTTAKAGDHPFYSYEPWDGPDGVEPRHTPGGARFQKSCQMSTKHMRMSVAGNQEGKAQPLYSTVFTPGGQKMMGAMNVGDKVCTPDGGEAFVSGVYPQGIRPVFRITLEDGTSCDCDRDHLWKVLTRKRASEFIFSHGKRCKNRNFEKWEVVTTQWLVEKYGTGEIPFAKRPLLPATAPVYFSGNGGNRPLHPYVVGVLLGDGTTIDRIGLSCADKDIETVGRFAGHLPVGAAVKRIPKTTCEWSVTGVRRYLKDIGMLGKRSYEKFISSDYLYSSVEDRIQLLRGLMDTDGSIYGPCAIEYSSSSERLAKDVQFLVRSLGGKASIRKRETKCRPSFRVRINIKDINPFSLNRKASRFRNIKHRKEMIIRRIDFVGMFQTQCIRVDSADHLYLTDNFIVTHNTYDRAIEAIIMMTGEVPYAMRVPDGVDTGVQRVVSPPNIKRWGRIDKTTRKIIDHNPEALPDDTWDCGNIIGVGVYPDVKICHENGQMVWICTYNQSRDDVWLSLLKKLIPEHCYDKTRAVAGFSKSEFTWFLLGGRAIKIKTYDQGWERVESFKAWHIILDEEPPDRRYYTGCLLHAHSLSFSFTPLRGMSWVYTDLYEEYLRGNPDIDYFHATKYDSPYADIVTIERDEKLLKSYERDPKIYGKFAQQEGRPYFDYDICKRYIDDYKPSYRMATILPFHDCQTIEELLKSAMKVSVVKTKSDANATWEVYEDPDRNTPYWMGADCARGNDNPDEAQDSSVAYIFRPPKEGEDPAWPVAVACLYTTEITENFAWLSLYGAIHYNCATIIPETKGEDGRAYFVELKDYPFWFKMTVVSDKTRRTTEHIGFDTNAGTRTPLFNKLRKYINAHDQRCSIRHHPLLIEMSKIIWKKGRPDHPDNGTSDCVVAYCLGLWLWEEASNQICNNRRRILAKSGDEEFGGLLLTVGVNNETKPVLGTNRGMDKRRIDRTWQRNRHPKSSRQTGIGKTLTLSKSEIF